MSGDIYALRAGMKTNMCTVLTEIYGSMHETAHPPTGNKKPITELIINLENAIYKSIQKDTKHQQYITTVHAVNNALKNQVDSHPLDILGIMFIRGDITAEDLVKQSLKPVVSLDPREIVRRMFSATLVKTHEKFSLDRKFTIDVARAIEVSCFNAVVKISKNSEDPPRRQWDSIAFVDIYGSRCGTINSMLDPFSSVCQTYGSTVIPKILDGTILPANLGTMTSKELCPQATILERNEIAKRIEQKVQRKESNLFRCPHCTVRKCVYQEVQRRSLDEAPDYLCLCLNCNRRFTGRS